MIGGGTVLIGLYHCATKTSGFHLWQFQVFNSGAEGLVVVLFWLDLWEIFFFGHTGVWTQDIWLSSPALYHCAMVTSGFHFWQFQVNNSSAEGLVVVLFLLDSTTVPPQLLVFTSENFRYLTVVQRDWWWYCFEWTCERYFFWPHWGLNLGPLDT